MERIKASMVLLELDVTGELRVRLEARLPRGLQS